jgi:hypothetical protein
MRTRPLAGFQERFLMILGVLELLTVALRVVLRPELTAVVGTSDLWIKWALFATTVVLISYSNATNSHEFWVLFLTLGVAYAASFVYLYVYTGVVAGVLLLASLALTMLIVCFAGVERDWRWPDFIYALWLAIGVSATLGQRGIIIAASD